MTYSVDILPAAIRALGRLEVITKNRLGKAIDKLAENPRPSGAKKLKGRINRWRIRVGDYRVIYDIEDKELRVLVVMLGHRREVYREL